MVSKSSSLPRAAGKDMTADSCADAAAAVDADWHCLFTKPFLLSVCPTQPGISHSGSGPNGRRDAADWSQRVFLSLLAVRLHHHTARRHVRAPCVHVYQ